MLGVILHPAGNRGIPSSPVGWLLPAVSQAGKGQLEVLPAVPGAGCFQRFPFLRSPESPAPERHFSARPAQSAGFPMLCGGAHSGGWGGNRIGACSSLAHTARKLPQNPLESFGVYTVVYQGKSPAQTVLFAHVALDHRRSAAQHDYRDGFEVKPRFHGCREKPFGVEAALFLDDASGVLVHAAGLSRQHSFHLRVGNGQSYIPADLFFRFVNAADHAKLQAAAGGSVRDAVVQPHEVHRPAADIHEQNRRLILDEFRVDGDGGIPLREQFHIFDGDFVGDSLKSEAHQLGRTQKVFPEGLFLPAKSGQRQSGSEFDGTLWHSAPLLDLLGDGGKGKQVVIVVLHFVSQDRLSAGSADIKLPAVLQCVLQGVGFMGIFRNTGWERKMPGFDGVVAVVDTDVHGFSHPFLTIVENLEGLLVLSKLAGENLVLSQPSK